MARERDEDDDYDDRPSRSSAKGPLDGMFANTNIVILILFAVCCNGIALILGLIALFTAKDPKAKSNAMLVTIIAGVITAMGIIAQVAGLAAGFGGAK